MTKSIVSAFASLLIASPVLAAPFDPPTSGAPIGRGGASRMIEVGEYQPPDVGGPKTTKGSGTR
jgi:hypothetical protein